MTSTETVQSRTGAQIPIHQADKNDGYHGIRVYSANGTVPSTLPSAGGTVTIDVEVGRRLKNPRLRISLSNSSAVTKLVPSSFWFDEITTSIDTAKVQDYYSLLGYILSNSTTPRDVYKAIHRDWNQDKYYNSNSVSLQSDIVGRQFFIELPGHWVDATNPTPDAISQKIRLTIKFNSSWVFSGTASNCTCTAVDLICEEDVLNAEEMAKEMRQWQTGRVRRFYSQQIAWPTTQTMTAGTQVEHSISAISGDVAALFVTIRGATATNANGNSYRFLSIGSSESDGICTVLDGGRDSIQYATNPNSEFLRKTAHQHFANGHFFTEKAIYGVVYTEDIESALDGSFDGFYKFKGNEFLRITPCTNTTTETAAVWTWSLDATATAGNFQLGMTRDGKFYQTGLLAFDATVVTILAELNLWGLPDLTFVVGGTVFGTGTGGLTVTVSGQKRDKDYGTMNMSIIKNALVQTTGALCEVTFAETTAGIPPSGCTATGSNLTIDVMGLQHYMVEFNKGRFVKAVAV